MGEIDFKGNAEKLAKALDYVGHGGYEEQPTVDGDKVYCSCAHCGSIWHQYIKVFSLDPLRVTISSYDIERDHQESDIEEYADIDSLRFSVEEKMANC